MEKEKLKNIIFKILHAIGYFSMIILTIIFVVSGVQSCNNKEHQPRNKNVNDIQYSTTLSNGDYLFSWDEQIDDKNARYYNYEILGDSNGYVDKNSMNEVLEILYNFIKNGYDEYNGDNTRYCSAYIKNGGQQIFDLYRVNRVEKVGNIYYYYNIYNEVKEIEPYSVNPPINKFEMLLLNVNFLKTFEGCFKYCIGLGESPNGVRSIEYYVNPYFVIKKNERSFYYNIAFSYQGIFYYAIEYVKDTHVKFYASNSNNNNLTFPLTLSYSGEVYYYRFGSITTNNVVSSKTFKFIAFGKLGYDFLNKYFINDNNPRISSVNTIDLYNIINWVDIQNVNDEWQRKTLSLAFNSAGVYYTGIYLDYLNHSDGTIGLNITYRRADMNNLLVIELFYPNYTGASDFDYSQIQLLTNETYANIITLNDVLYTSDVVFVLDFIYSPYGVIEPPTIPQGDAFASTFDLLTMAFNSVGGVLNIYILPNLTLGTLLIIPLLLTILLFVIWLFKR